MHEASSVVSTTQEVTKKMFDHQNLIAEAAKRNYI
jgi:hypothetical protein